ncbi:MAG: S1 RNA-binding domain-containing protein, partial [Candidatus Pacebacteria bacterium]|nr:S1 RNA-binding domain-containing protein [Candidatus Paceibacterota bacterium]
MEQKAIEAERDSISFKYTQYYSVRIGEKFSGIITGIIKFGFFVEDENTKAQGMVNVRNMGNDFFEYYEKTQYLKGKNTNKIFKLGIRVEAEVIGVDIEKRKIEL